MALYNNSYTHPISQLSYRWSTFINPSPPLNREDRVATGVCFKIFIIASIVLAAVAIVTGVIALIASRGGFGVGMEPLSQFNVIGEVNSCVMISGGIALFILGILAWTFQLKKEMRNSK